ncbi:hypothetical protein [Nocardioides sp.]|uniref:hypothetical protein n=1 Tax=Nocardioides sp. TaxID=35761 RepID=UPI00273265A3|nr:hypothetical protein [Nocardioides sp.]MDP3893151.1 hypothetical protein [Nocardioides sp.]
MAFVRSAAHDQRPEHLHLIPLYEERPVVVVPRDHVVTAFDEVTAAEIADEVLELPDSMPWRDRVAVVAGGAGLSVVPQSVARDFQRKDLAWRPVSDLPSTRVGLAWLREPPGSEPDPLIEEFIGVVRGRTARSSRGETRPPPAKPRERRRGR